MIGDARLARVDVGAAELLGRHLLPRRRLHQRRPADEDRPRPGHDHRLVAHRRHVGAARRARAHHDRDLRDPLRRHPRLVEEDPPEVVAVGEHLRLQRQKRPARVDEVDARQPVLLRDLLRAQMLLHRQREVRAALHGRIVRDDHALAALDHADPGHDPRRRRLTVVHIPRRQLVQLQKRRSRIDQPVDPLPRRQLAPRAMPLQRPLAAAAGDQLRALPQLGDQRLHPRMPAHHVVGLLERASQHSHARSLLGAPARSACCGHEPRSPHPVARRGDRRRGGRCDRRRPPWPQLGEEPRQGVDDARRPSTTTGSTTTTSSAAVNGPAAIAAPVRRNPAARRHPRQAERSRHAWSCSRTRSARSATSGTSTRCPP